jgi:hypothetical protein
MWRAAEGQMRFEALTFGRVAEECDAENIGCSLFGGCRADASLALH